MAEHRFQLEKYAGPKSRFTCPSCGKPKQLSRYVDTETRDYLREDVGLCNRVSNCGYHMTPKEYFKENGNHLLQQQRTDFKQFKKLPIKTKTMNNIIDYVAKRLFAYTILTGNETNFYVFLKTIFGEALATLVCSEYFLGQSKADDERACIFWQVDKDNNVRTGKIMCYDPVTGKRKKEPGLEPKWVHSSISPNYNLKQCFFGEHLIGKHPSKPVAIVESEKTAIIAAVFMPQYNWVATGGVHGTQLSNTDCYQLLNNRNVLLFPDFGWSNFQKKVTCFEAWSEKADNLKSKINIHIQVSDLLEKMLSEDQRSNGYDIADHLVKQDPETLLAVNGSGIPIKDTMSPEEWLKKFTDTS